MADVGIKISLPGKDVSSTDPRDYVFHSGFGSVKIYSEPPNRTYETITVSAGGTNTVSISHGLPFIPMVMWFTELSPGSGHWYGGAIAWPDTTDASTSIYLDAEVSSGTYVDDTYIKVKYNNTSGSDLTVKYYYYIFANTG